MNTRYLISLLVLPALVLGCADNPAPVTGPDPSDGDGDHGHPTEEVSVELSVTPDHVHIWQTETIFTVRATDHDGGAVTDFDSLRVERKAHGSDTWRAIDLTQEGDAYAGSYVFASSGDYDIRVVGMLPGDHEMGVLHEMSEHFHVARAHAEAGPYRVEFESFPGHMHEGDEATLRFWVMEPERDDAGNRAPISGLTAQVHCLEEAGIEELHDAVETEPGVYEATHHIQEAGALHAGLHLHGPDGSEIEGAIDTHVAHGH